MSNSAFDSGERRYLEPPERLCLVCLEAESTEPDGMCDDCAKDHAENCALDDSELEAYDEGERGE